MSDQNDALDELIKAFNEDEYWNPSKEVDVDVVREMSFLKHLSDTLRTLYD